MNELTWVYGTAALMVATFLCQVLRKRFDPFAPVWLFFVGYVQIYVVQAISYHEWALKIRGAEIVNEANLRAFWALAWFLLVYHFGPGKVLARLAPRPPLAWSTAPVNMLCPLLLVWGLYCARASSGIAIEGAGEVSAEASLIASFAMVMLVAGSMCLITGRQESRPRPLYLAAGLAIVGLYLLLWMFNGKRSHSLVAVLVGLCSYYVPRFKRPGVSVLAVTAVAGVLAVGVSIGWRFHASKNGNQKSAAMFLDFVTGFDPVSVLESINVKEREAAGVAEHMKTYETEEYGGYLLMLDTVPFKSDYDHGLPYLRVFSTFIPRIIWQEKPIYGRDKWVEAWMAGSEQKRTIAFSGPAIGILGATQLNGGVTGTVIVLGFLAILLRGAYEFFRLHEGSPWAQLFWATGYYNAWFMTVNDDPANWFYYNWGFTTMPSLIVLWAYNKLSGGGRA